MTSNLTPSLVPAAKVNSRRVNLSICLAIASGLGFVYCIFKLHDIIWQHYAPPDTIIRGDGFLRPLTVIMGVTAAFSVGAAGLCALPLFDRLRLGYTEYSRTYGPPGPNLNYPWRIDRVTTLLFWIGPLMVLLALWYMFEGYAISPELIVYRQGPISTFSRIPWSKIKSIDISCFEDRRGFLEDFVIFTNRDKLDLGMMNFDIYGKDITPVGRNIANLVAQYHIRSVNGHIVQGCHSPDISAIFQAANLPTPRAR